MSYLRPADLAREHGLSAQTVRNYEHHGFLPPADRSETGYRRYTGRHAAALRTYLALVPAHGYAEAGTIMRATVEGRLDDALTAVDRSHAELLRDRGTLDAVGEALAHLHGRPSGARRPTPRVAQPFTIGELARRLGVGVATVRAWEQAGVLVPRRRPDTNHRAYDADDVRDAELAHFLRRGHYPLRLIATVVQEIRTAGDTRTLESALADWRARITSRSRAMLKAAALLSDYLALEDEHHSD
ncbi:MerR family transcriptional regulator [Streptomyces hydrogenans]|uniref:MerR family transcriptional regulator n=1 Tax=Streptomyces hydrogenans TaxID=1873719 RepID=UPI003441A71A